MSPTAGFHQRLRRSAAPLRPKAEVADAAEEDYKEGSNKFRNGDGEDGFDLRLRDYDVDGNEERLEA
jgi:hypothetical protein